jgi:negative regulator of sigma E activity
MKNSRWVPFLRSLVVVFAFFFFGFLADEWLRRHVHSWYMTTLDDALIALVVGVLVLVYEQRQRQQMIKKLEVIRLMNHHVRNSLQVISFAASAQQQKTAEQLEEAVDRIEWALREVLPGQRDDIDEFGTSSSLQESPARRPKDAA